MKKKTLASAILCIALCLCLIAGSTFALFTSESTVNVAVTAGNVDVVATIDNTTLKVWSLNEAEPAARRDTFTNGGKAAIDSNGQLVINRMTPGDVVKFTINVKNNSDVAIKYRVKATSTIGDNANAKDLSEVLVSTATVNGVTHTMKQSNKSFESAWISVEAPNGVGGNITAVTVVITFPNGTPAHDNPFKKATAKLALTVEAVQGNGVDANGNLITP